MTLIFVPFINLDCSSSKDASSELSLIFKSIFFKVKSFDLKYGVEKISSLDSYDDKYYLVKEEVTHYGDKKLILKSKSDGKIIEKIIKD